MAAAAHAILDLKCCWRVACQGFKGQGKKKRKGRERIEKEVGLPVFHFPYETQHYDTAIFWPVLYNISVL